MSDIEKLLAIAEAMDELDPSVELNQQTYWMNSINNNFQVGNSFEIVFNNLKSYPNRFFNYHRMSILSFGELLEKVGQYISKQNTTFLNSISAEKIISQRFGVEVLKVSPILITIISVCLLLIVIVTIVIVKLKTANSRKRNSRQPTGGDKQVIVHQRSNGQVASSILETDTDPDLIQVKYDPSDAPKLRNGGVQFSDDSHDPSVAGWIAANAAVAQTSQLPLSSSSSSSTGTLRRGTAGTAINDRQPPPPPVDAARRWNDVTPKPFSYTHHHQHQQSPPQPPHHVRVRPDPIELDGADIKEKLMMSSGHIPESCV